MKAASISVVVIASACTVFDHRLPPRPTAECTVNSECTASLGVPAWCVQQPLGHCVALMSDDCSTITGEASDDNAILIASLLSTTGAQGATNLARQQSAQLAVEEINQANASGGILQSSTPGDTRKLVMLSCDEAANFPRAATHLVTELQVPAIVGPNLSQDTLDFTIGDPMRSLPSSAQAGTVLLTPAAVASAIVTVPDNGLTFMMVPADIFRIPLMKQQINALETQLRAARMRQTIKLAIFYRNDAFGQGTSDALATLTLNGNSLAQEIQLGHARIDSYDPAISSPTPLIAPYVTFAPDIIVAVGTGEIVDYFMSPLETAWTATDRPYYVATDSTKVPGLLTAVTGNDNFRQRVRGTGVTTTAETAPVFSAFQVLYGQRWKDAMGNPQPSTISNMGPSYDAVYSIALALVGQSDASGATIAQGLYKLGSLAQTCTTDAQGFVPPCFAPTDYARTLYATMRSLLSSTAITDVGTFGRYTWDSSGAKNNGLIEMWCINGSGPKPIFQSSGLKYDVATQAMTGVYAQCPP